MTGVLVIPDVEPRPAIEGAFGDGGGEVRRQIVAEAVPFVDRAPERAALRLNGEAEQFRRPVAKTRSCRRRGRRPARRRGRAPCPTSRRGSAWRPPSCLRHRWSPSRPRRTASCRRGRRRCRASSDRRSGGRARPARPRRRPSSRRCDRESATPRRAWPHRPTAGPNWTDRRRCRTRPASRMRKRSPAPAARRGGRAERRGSVQPRSRRRTRRRSGAVRMTRGMLRPEAKRSTAKSGGAVGTTTCVRGARCGGLAMERVAKGGGMSAGVMSLRTPGASLRQPPKAAGPLRIGRSAAREVAAMRQPARATKRTIHPPLRDEPTGAVLFPPLSPAARDPSRRIRRSAGSRRRSPSRFDIA